RRGRGFLVASWPVSSSQRQAHLASSMAPGVAPGVTDTPVRLRYPVRITQPNWPLQGLDYCEGLLMGAVDRKGQISADTCQLVNARSDVLFRRRQLPHDRVDDAGVHRLDVGGENRGDVAIATDEVFVKVPARRLQRALA